MVDFHKFLNLIENIEKNNKNLKEIHSLLIKDKEITEKVLVGIPQEKDRNTAVK